MRRLGITCTLTVLLAALPSCVGESKKAQEEDQRRLASYILDAAPANIAHRLDINYDNKVTLLGYDIEPRGNLEPDSRIKLTLYWRSDQELEPDWLLFTHVFDEEGNRILNIDNVGPLRQWKETRQALPPSVWKPGKVYVDEQSFTLADLPKVKEIQITTGIWKGNKRLVIVSGPHDDESRGLVLKKAIGRPTAQPPKPKSPRLEVLKLPPATKITIDGKLDDDAWKTAPSSGAFVDVSTGQTNTSFPVDGQVLVLWDDAGAYFGFSVKDSDLQGGFDAKLTDPHLWMRDTVEIMLDPDGDGDNQDYYEIQIGPQNLVFDSQFDRYNKPKTEPHGPYGHQDWSSKIQSAVVIRGTLDKPEDKDEGYTVEAFLPWKSLTKAKKTPPGHGDTWRMNFYAMQNNGGVAWSPILRQGNFHRASRFGYVTWLTALTTPPPAPLGSAPLAPLGSAPLAPLGSAPLAPLGSAPVAPLGSAPPATSRAAASSTVHTPSASPAPAGPSAAPAGSSAKR